MSNDAIAEIKQRLPIEQYIQKYVPLRRNGTRWTGLCPFHQEKSPSFSVNSISGFFYCFGCHASGDIFSFVTRYHGLEFKEALHNLAEEAGVSLQSYSSSLHSPQSSLKQQLFAMYKVANTHFVNTLHKPSSTALDYFTERGLSSDIITQFSLGYSLPSWDSLLTLLRRSGFSKEHIIASGLIHHKGEKLYDAFRDRYIFPIIALSGAVIAFGGRIHPQAQNTEQAKYINSPETAIYTKGKHLYGLAQARKMITIEKKAILTEGYIDVLTLHQFGYTNAIAVLGTALTQEHARLLSSFVSTVELVFDSDTAGRKASLTATKLLLTEGVKVRVITLPEGEDIDSFLRSYGKEAFEEQRRQSKEGLDFCIETVQKLSPKEIIAWLHAFLNNIEDPLLLAQYVKKLSFGFGIPESSIYTSTIEKAFQEHTQEEQPAYTVSEKERTLLKHIITYPHNIDILRNAGLDLVLTSHIATDIAHAIYKFSTNYQAIHNELSYESQIIFSQLLIDIHPSEYEKNELEDILTYLTKEDTERYISSAKHIITGMEDIEGLMRIQNILHSRVSSME